MRARCVVDFSVSAGGSCRLQPLECYHLPTPLCILRLYPPLPVVLPPPSCCTTPPFLLYCPCLAGGKAGGSLCAGWQLPATSPTSPSLPLSLPPSLCEQVYGFSTSQVQTAILQLFCRTDCLLPNAFVGTLTRESVLQAVVESGISSDDIIEYLRSHAHPQAAARAPRPVVPEVRGGGRRGSASYRRCRNVRPLVSFLCTVPLFGHCLSSCQERLPVPDTSCPSTSFCIVARGDALCCTASTHTGYDALSQTAYHEPGNLTFPTQVVMDQVRLWEAETVRVRYTDCVLYEEFETPQLYESSVSHALNLRVLLWRDDANRKFAARQSGGWLGQRGY